MAFRIEAEQLGAEGFRLDLGGSGDAHRLIALKPGGGIRGVYDHGDEVIGLREIQADTLSLSELAWPVPGGSLSIAAPSHVHDVYIDAEIRRGDESRFVGTIKAQSVHAAIDLRLRGVTIRGATVVIQGLEIEAGEDGVVTVRLGHVAAESIEVVMQALTVFATEVAAPGAVTIRGETLEVERLTVGRLQAAAQGLSAGASAADPERSRASVPSLPLLDTLCGHLHVDLVTDVRLPIIGERKATHAFRIPIDEGVIPIAALEDGLSTLESLAIDFEIEPGKLILEKDLPLVPFDAKPLVHWTLDERGDALAKDKRVRIATLLQPELPEATREQAEEERRSKGSAVSLRRVDAADIDVAVSLERESELELGGGRIRLGSAQRAALEELRITGSVSHVPQEPAPGELQVVAKSLLAALEGLQVGGRTLSAARVVVGIIDTTTLTFEGLRPSRLQSELHAVHLEALHLGPRS